jgi:hypothetical protein
MSRPLHLLFAFYFVGPALAGDTPAWIAADLTITNRGQTVALAQGTPVTLRARSGSVGVILYDTNVATVPLAALSTEPVAGRAPTPAPEPTATPAPTPLQPTAEKVALLVRGVGEQGIIAERLTLQKVPGSSGTMGPGGFVRYPQSLQTSGQFLVLLDYSRQSEVAEGDTLEVRAYRDGVFNLRDAHDADRTVPAWRAVE